MSDPAPHFVVRKHDPAARRRRLAWAGTGLLLVVLSAGAAGFLLGREMALTNAEASPRAPVLVSDEALAQQVATLTRSEQVAAIAAEDLRKTLAEREEEISALRADLAFYSRLVGSGEQRTGIAVHSVHLQPIDGARAYNVDITLTQNAKRGDQNEGRVQLAVEGVLDGTLVVLNWDDLGDPQHAEGLRYAFKYFQQLHASVMLPENFTPNRLRVSVQPEGGAEVTRGIPWDEALKAEDGNVQ